MSKRISILAIATLLAFLHVGPSAASCWSSNPDGSRYCGNFVSKYGLEEQLCEDVPGDCVQEGYTLATPKPKEHRRSVSRATPIPPPPSERSYEPAPIPADKTAAPLEETRVQPPDALLDFVDWMAFLLSVLLAAIGFWILPSTHRNILIKGVGSAVLIAVIAISAFAAGLVAEAASTSRRRRY